MSHTKSIEIGGRKLTLETGKLAKQANGAVLISLDENYVLCTVKLQMKQTGSGFFSFNS